MKSGIHCKPGQNSRVALPLYHFPMHLDLRRKGLSLNGCRYSTPTTALIFGVRSGWLAAPLRNWPIWEWELPRLPGKAKKPYPILLFLTIPSRGLKTFNCRGTVHSPHHTARPVVSSTGFPLHRVETAGRRKSRGDCEPCNFQVKDTAVNQSSPVSNITNHSDAPEV